MMNMDMLRSSLLLLTVFVSLGVQSQSLESEVVRLTRSFCSQLGNTMPIIPNPDFGPNLQLICLFSSPGGGGGGSIPTNTALGSAADAETVSHLSKQANRKSRSAASAENAERAQFDHLGLFVSADWVRDEKDETEFSQGYDRQRKRINVGVDYRAGSDWVIGAALGLQKADANFDVGGGYDATRNEIHLFSNNYLSDRTYFNASVGFASESFDTTRIISGLYALTPIDPTEGVTTSSHDEQEQYLRMGLGSEIRDGRLTLLPQVAYRYLNRDIDGMREQGTTGLQLELDDRAIYSSQLMLSVDMSYPVSRSYGVLVPQISVGWTYEYNGSPGYGTARFVEDLRDQPLTFVYQTDAPDADFTTVDLSLSATLKNGVIPFVRIGGLYGHDYLDRTEFAVGFRLER